MLQKNKIREWKLLGFNYTHGCLKNCLFSSTTVYFWCMYLKHWVNENAVDEFYEVKQLWSIQFQDVITIIYLCLHQLLLSAFGTNDIILIGDETASDQTRTAHCTEKAIVVPVAVFEWDEFCTTNSCNEKYKLLCVLIVLKK